MIIDLIAIILSFIVALGIRFNGLVGQYRFDEIVSWYIVFFLAALILYMIFFLFRRELRLERLSYREILVVTIEQQIVFIVGYIIFFFLFQRAEVISRIVVVLFFTGNIIFCSIGRIFYHNYCVSMTRKSAKIESAAPIPKEILEGLEQSTIKHVYLCGVKSIGLYGGFETFILNLLKHHSDNPKLKYHVACKANGSGCMELEKLPGALRINNEEFTYCNAHCFMIKIPEWIGSAQAVFYDLKALKWICDHIEKNHIMQPVVYILAPRIGILERKYVERIHDAGGLVYQNTDGHEDWRRKWNRLVRKYWKLSERYAVKNADLVICDSKNIESYIKDEYGNYDPKTAFIAYGSDICPSKLSDSDAMYVNWLKDHNLKDGKFYIIVARFVPENNFDIIIREFMRSRTNKDLAIITTDNPKYRAELQQKCQYKKDKRIKFVGTVYDVELLAKIRENAYGYIHGHEVGGTNPSLLESLGSTRLNLLLDVSFNREVAEDAALYWSKEDNSLAELINTTDRMSKDKISSMGDKAKQRIRDEYSWEKICEKYEEAFLNDGYV